MLDPALDPGREEKGRQHSSACAGEPSLPSHKAAGQDRTRESKKRGLVADLAELGSEAHRRMLAMSGEPRCELDVGAFQNLDWIAGRSDVDEAHR
jgi:hypothetical protein